MKTYKLLGADGKIYESETPGEYGGNGKLKVYGSNSGLIAWILSFPAIDYLAFYCDTKKVRLSFFEKYTFFSALELQGFFTISNGCGDSLSGSQIAISGFFALHTLCTQILSALTYCIIEFINVQKIPKRYESLAKRFETAKTGWRLLP